MLPATMSSSTRAPRRMRTSIAKPLIAQCLLALVFVLASAPVGHAQRTGYLVRMLRESDTFRVRVQAAVSLGRVEAEESVVQALGAALRDEHPAVRTAAASSLERLADPEALDALRAARRDRDSGVRAAVRRAISALERVARTRPRDTGETAGARFYVGVGEPGNPANVNASLLRVAQSFLREQVAALPGVSLAPANESNSAARRVLSQRNLAGFYIDSSIVRIERNGQGTRAVVSVVVNTYPGRDMRAILNGAATVPGATDDGATRAAIEGALRGAMRRLTQAMEASAR